MIWFSITNLETPKSQSLIWPWWIRILSSLMSLCSIALSWQYFMAFTICKRYFLAEFSSIFLIFFIILRRSPPSANSMTRNIYCLFSKTSNSLIIFLWTAFFIIKISENIFFKADLLLILRFSIHFSATFFPVSN